MDLVLFGRQGSGKGTQGTFLTERYGLLPFVTGDQLRRLAKEESELGKKVKSIMEAGNLVPNEVVMEIIENFMNNVPEGKSVLFDGIPRKMEQAESFNALMKKMGRDLTGVLIEISNETAFARLKKRSEIEGRADDANVEIIQTRLDNYQNQTVPVIDLYRSEGKIIEIDGEPPIETITQTLFEALDSKFE